jgi:hypothetical protein
MKYFFLLYLLAGVSIADVVKPALVEISIYADKKVSVVIDLSLEAAMTDIGTQYKNTIDAPNSVQYDILRALTPKALQVRFKTFESKFLSHILLTINKEPQHLKLISAEIDIVGYKKRPRKTLLTYSTQLSEWPKTLLWQYNKSYGDSAGITWSKPILINCNIVCIVVIGCGWLMSITPLDTPLRNQRHWLQLYSSFLYT